MKNLWLSAVVSCVWFLPMISGDIYVYKRITHDDITQFEDAQSRFGPSPPSEGLRGLIVYSSPELACTEVDGPPPNGPYNYGNWILLIKRGNCSFEEKVRNAQYAGYTAAIVHNINSSDLEPMGPDDVPDILIPSVFIGSADAEMIMRRFMWNSTYYVVIHDLPFDLTIHMLLIFSVLVGLCFLGMVIFIIIKFFKDRRQQRRHRLPTSSLKNIPIHKFKTNDPFDTCVICLEDFVDGDKLRVLPCMHAYHMKCIDPWLTKKRRVCPVCKRKVPTSKTAPDSSDSEEESRPLLGGAPSASTSAADVSVTVHPRTRSTPTENAFQRARRHFLGLTESIASSISSTRDEIVIDSSDDDYTTPPVSERTSETGSLLHEPSVNA